MTWGEMKRWAEANKIPDGYEVIVEATCVESQSHTINFGPLPVSKCADRLVRVSQWGDGVPALVIESHGYPPQFTLLRKPPNF